MMLGAKHMSNKRFQDLKAQLEETNIADEVSDTLREFLYEISKKGE